MAHRIEASLITVHNSVAKRGPGAGFTGHQPRTHRVVGHLHVDDYERRKAVLAGEVRLGGQCWRRGQLHVLRNVRQLEVKAVSIHVQQPAWQRQCITTPVITAPKPSDIVHGKPRSR